MSEMSLVEIDESDNAYKLTAAEERLLEVLLNPENTGKTITEKSELAGISRQCYYEIMRKEEFKALLKKSSVELIKEKISDVIAASVKVATNSGARGFQDRKMLLEMAGVYVPEQKITGDFNLAALTDTNERRRRIDELERQLAE